MTAVYIRRPDTGETPLSPTEQWVAVREGFHPVGRGIAGPRYHPALTRNWSLMSARLHRSAAVARAPAFAEGAR